MDNTNYKGIEYARIIGKQIVDNQNIYCPRCTEGDTEYNAYSQHMSGFGGIEHCLFCPHCELGFSIICETKLE